MKITHKHIKITLLILTILAAIKMLLQNFSLDEEYQVLMSYRHIMGDEMLSTMWEPHQTSSFLCSLFAWPYYLITGTFTGIVIYLRFMGTLVHLGVSFYLYKILRHFLRTEYSFYLALIFFNTIPKLIMLPEFGGMQVWFGVLCFLLIIDSVEHITFAKKQAKTHTVNNAAGICLHTYIKLILAALSLCMEVLSYPSCALLYVPFVIMIWYSHKEQRFTKCLLFTGTCGVIGGIYVGYFVLKLGFDVFLRNVEAILNSDLTHTFETGTKLASLAECLLQYAVIFLVLTVLACLIAQIPIFKKHLPVQKGLAVIGMTITLANLYQIFMWVVLNKGYERLQIHLAVTLCLGLWLLCFKLPQKDTFTHYMWFGVIIGILSLACIMMLTDLTLLASIPHGMLGSICMLALLVYLSKEHKPYALFLLITFCLTACVGKGYTLRDGFGSYNNVLQSRGICKYGPAIGTITNYMGAYIYNNEYNFWQENIESGSKVMIVTANVQSVNTIQYTFKNAEVCHYSIVDPTAYDERLLTYWSYYPNKVPDVIVVDCWFGNLFFEEDSWIMQYIENDFGYTEVIDGDYVRVYKR